MKGFRTLSIAIGLALSLVAPVGAAYAAGQRTGNPNPALFPRPAHPYGASMATWGERVGQWIYRQPFPHNPAFDQTGADCAVDQHGPQGAAAGHRGRRGRLSLPRPRLPPGTGPVAL